MKKVLIAAIFSACAFAVLADDFSYKGVKLGDSMEKFKEALPLYQCRTETCTYIRDSCSSIPGLTTSQFTRRLDECRDGTSFGGALVTYGSATFIEGRLAKIYLKSPWMDQLNSALIEKFGQPATVDTTPVRNKIGTEYANWVKTWKSGSDSMIATQRAGKIDEGSVLILGAAAEEQARTQQSQQTKAGAKDF